MGGGVGSWNDTLMWTSLLNDHDVPGIAGDKIVTTSAAEITLNGDTTISGITDGGGRLQLIPAVPSTITFDSGDPAVTNRNIITRGAFSQGIVNTIAPNSDIVFNIVRNLRWTFGRTGDANFRAYIGAKISGGDVSSPVDFLVDCATGDWSAFALLNPDNDFYGDVRLGSANTTYVNFQLGYGNHVGWNSCLGDPANKVYLHGNSALRIKSGDPNGLRRTVIGNGTVSGTSIDGTYNGFNSDNLLLGEGCSLEPMILPSNPIGVITVSTTANWGSGKTIIAQAGSQVVLALGASGQRSRIAFNSTGAVSFYGKIIMNPLDDYPLGTQWDIMTVNSVPFTFDPSFVSSGFNLTLIGNATSGWTVRATKVRDISVAPDISTLPVDKIGETFATFNFEVLGAEPDAVTVRAYISATGDKGVTTQGWDAIVECPASVAAAGRGSFDVDFSATALWNLPIGATYHVRHSISNSAGEFVSLDFASFATRPWETPDVFVMDVNAGDWHDENSWRHVSPYARNVPGFIGDEVQMHMLDPAGNKTLGITNDVMISNVRIYDGEGMSATFSAPESPVTLTFDSATADMVELAASGYLRYLNLGTARDDDLTIALNKPLNFTKNTAYLYDANVWARLTGGSDSEPSHIYLDMPGNEWAHLHFRLMNTNNTFRGDIYVGNTGSGSSTTELRVGESTSFPAFDAMLGHTNNAIILRRNGFFSLYASTSVPAVFQRHLRGDGTISAGTGNEGGYAERLNAAAGLILAPSAIFQPHARTSEDAFGAITIRATSLASDPAAQYIIKIDSANEAASDKIAVTVNGPVDLNGKVLIVPTDIKVPIGQEWDIMTIAPTASSFASRLKIDAASQNPFCGFVLSTKGDATEGWTVSVKSIATGTLLMVR